MKKRISLLAILMMAMTAWAEDLAVVHVTTWAGLQDYMNSANRASNICVLDNDIDFQGGEIADLDYGDENVAYYIDGNNHTIKNGVLKDGQLIYTAKYGYIKNLKFEGLSSNTTILVRIAYSGFTFENLSFKECHVSRSSNIAALVCNNPQYNVNLGLIYNQDPIKFSNITITNCSVKGGSRVGSIIGCISKYEHTLTSQYFYPKCEVTNCHVTGTSVQGSGFVGGIAGFCRGNFKNCSFSGKVLANISSATADCGGIVGKTLGGSIVNCTNYAEVEGNDNNVGGIVGYADPSQDAIDIQACKNMGWIHHTELAGSDDYIGGIVGYGNPVHILNCTNAGSIDGGDEYAGGIAGCLEGASSVAHCVNGGFVNGKTHVGGIAGQITGTTTVKYCIGASSRIEGGEHKQLLVGEEPSGSTSNNYWISNTSDIETGAVTAADLKSGKVAWHINTKAEATGENYIWGQLLTNQGVGIEDYPMPGGKRIYQHTTNCKGESCLFYSNYEHTHYGDIILKADGSYICTYCNQTVADGANYVTSFVISTAQDLANFSTYVNNGYSRVNATVNNDIDCSSLSSFAPIGSQSATYCGIFDGQGHRIKNLQITGSQNGLGLFGALGNGATIKNLILDASCSVTGNGASQAGIAGLAGCVYAAQGQNPVDVYLENCGNEANISGFSNVGGILGGVYNNDLIHVYMTRCYNMGTISATETSAALAGWLYKYFDIKQCWNTGTVTHTGTSDKLVYRRADDASLTNVTNVYSTVAQEGEGVTLITANDVRFGNLCNMLNDAWTESSDMVWTQNLETDAYPYFGHKHLHYARSMSNEWGTIVLPFKVYYIPNGNDYRLYKLSEASVNGNTGTLTFTEYGECYIPAGTPMVVRNVTGTGINIVPAANPDFKTTITVQNTENASLPSGWTMNGTFTNLTNQENIYFIAQNKFWWAESPITIAPYRAWFAIPAPTNGVKAFNIEIEDDDVTGIHEIVNGKLSNGKYLENGKVVIVRNGKKFNLNGQALK